ncbi:APC family permease [Polycladomyces subterraneus]|uniref:APC family permease n=1 Tax=Polycladomyces subterraneus TaxID=1016997 RepID=A0ABT8IP38_9BACL|nr:APC family permease [Polycladomyces subterraneus]MDN4594505.1 APC family permease [Polycladomyces subterraneus]
MSNETRKGLSSNALSLFDSIVMSIAGTAPAYSISATTAVLIGAVGLQAPAAMLWCGIPMFGVVMAFLYLNRWHANAGASYAWVGKALNADLGFLSGWALIVSATLFMVAGSFPAGSVTLDIFAPKLSNNLLAVTIVGGLWFLIISFLVMKGIKVTATVQWIMSGIEIIILVISGIVALVKFGAHPVNAFHWSWFSPSAFPSPAVFISGALIATFYYWGWDVSANLNEETKDSRRIPGLGAMIGIIFIFAIFELFTVATQLGMSLKDINDASSNILQHLGVLLYGPVWGNVMVLAVALSTIATLETTLLQVTRTLFAMGRDGVISKKFGAVHPKWRTPYVASIVITIFALLLFVLSNFLSSINTVMTYAINAIGLQVVFYYGLTCLAVIFYYRKVLFQSVPNFIFLFTLPLVAAIFLLTVGIADIPKLGITTDSIGIGLIAIGIIPLLWGRFKRRASFYYQPREVYTPGTEGSNNRSSVSTM